MHVSNYLYCLIFTLGYFCEISATILVPVQGVSNCTIVPSKGRSIKYINWPFRLSCDHLATEDWLRAYGVDVSRDGILPCYVRNPQDRIISPETPISLNSTTPRLTTYTVYQVLNSTHCLSNDIIVELRHLPNRTCVDDVTYAGEHNINVELVASHIGGPEITLECQPAQNAGPATVFPPFTSGSNIQTKWYRSKVNRTSQVGCATRIMNSDACFPIITSAISNNRKFLLSDRTDRPKALKIFGYNFYDPGVYSCEVNYEGQVAYVAHVSLCIQQKVNVKEPPSILCTQNYKFVHYVEVTCSVKTQLGKINSNDLNITWTKGTATLCEKMDLANSPVPSATSQRITCGLDGFSNAERKCFRYEPDSNEVQAGTNTFNAYFIFKNMVKSDAGSYMVTVQYKSAVSATAEFQLEFDNTIELTRIGVGVGVSLAILVLIIIVAGLIRYYWFRIKLIHRRHFGKYDLDNKKYLAILSYYYDSSTSKEVHNSTKSIVKCINQLVNTPYRIFDSHRDLQGGGFSVGSLLKYLDESHRMIIILTEDYIKDRWARFEAEQGLINMMNSRTKLIFITTKGVNKAMRNSMNFPRGLSDALKMVHVILSLPGSHGLNGFLNFKDKVARTIKWKPSMDEKQFQAAVACALPNLQPRNSAEDTQLTTV